MTFRELDTKARKLEKDTNNKVKFLSPEDLSEIVTGAFFLIMEEWTRDCRDSLRNNNNKFKNRIMCVKTIVERHAAMIVEEKDLN